MCPDPIERQSVGRWPWLFAVLVFEIIAATAFHGFADASASWARLVIGGLIFGLPILFAAWVLLGKRFRFGLRELLILVTLVAVVAGMAIAPMRQFRQERATAKIFMDSGMRVWFDQGQDWIEDEQSRATPFWMQPYVGDLIGVGKTEKVRGLMITEPKHLRVLLEHLHELDHFQDLSVRNAEAMDRQKLDELMRWVRDNPKIRQIDIASIVPDFDLGTSPIQLLWLTVYAQNGLPGRTRNRLEGLHHFAGKGLTIYELTPNDEELKSLKESNFDNIQLRLSTSGRSLDQLQTDQDRIEEALPGKDVSFF